MKRNFQRCKKACVGFQQNLFLCQLVSAQNIQGTNTPRKWKYEGTKYRTMLSSVFDVSFASNDSCLHRVFLKVLLHAALTHLYTCIITLNLLIASKPKIYSVWSNFLTHFNLFLWTALKYSTRQAYQIWAKITPETTTFMNDVNVLFIRHDKIQT